MNKWARMGILWGGFTLMGGWPMAEVRADAPATTGLDCEPAFEVLQSQSPTPETLLARWQLLKSQCEKSTGYYEYQLAKLYIQNRQYEQAAQALAAGRQIPSSLYEKELLLGVGDIQLHQKKYAAAEQAYRQVVQQYPQWHMGYSYLGFSLFAQDRLEDARQALTQANQLQEYWDTYRNLTLVYYLQDNHEMAIDALNRAFSLNADIVRDRDPMVAGIRSYAEVGKFEVAVKLLSLMLAHNPDIRADAEYLRAGFFVKQKMIDAGLLEPQP